MQGKGREKKETENVCECCEEHSRGDLLPPFRGAPNVEAPQSGEVGRSLRASRSELMHPSGRSQAPHPTPLFKEWATRVYMSKEVFKHFPHTSPCVSPRLWGLASNGKIKKW